MDGTDCVMLSGETANGDFPLNAVDMMARVCVEAEGVTNYERLFRAVRGSVMDELSDSMGPVESIASSGVITAMDLKAKLILVCTNSGETARYVCKYRPEVSLLFNKGLFHHGRQSVVSLMTLTDMKFVCAMGNVYVTSCYLLVVNDYVRRVCTCRLACLC